MVGKFFKLFSDSVHGYWINLEQIEQVNPEANEVWMTSGECYTLNDDDFDAVLDYVGANEYKAQ